MALVTCAGCGSENDAAPGLGGFKCAACQRNNWVFRCRRCKQPITFWAELPRGAGTTTFRCGNCGKANSFYNQQLREIAAEARRVASARRVLAQQQRRQAAELAQQQKRRAAEIAQQQKRQAAETAQAYKARREQEAQQLTATAQRAAADLRGLLVSSLDTPVPFSFASLRQADPDLAFEAPGPASVRPADGPPPPPPDGSAPVLEDFLSPRVHGLGALVPGGERRRQRQQQEAEQALTAARQRFDEQHRQYEQALEAYKVACRERAAEFEREKAAYESNVEAARATFEQELQSAKDSVAAHNLSIDDLERRYTEGDAIAVSDFLTQVVQRLTWPFDAPAARLAFSQASSQAVIEIELPPFTVVPTTVEYRYVATRDELSEKHMSDKDRRELYGSLVAQIALRTIRETFRGDPAGVVTSVAFNGHVTTVDPKTGHEVHPCLVTVRTTRDEFSDIELHKVDPIECLKGLKASLSRQPSELVPVKPVVNFDMVDPRFVKEADVLAALDDRPNLMELSPSEFESLVTNLFSKMGLETRLTRPSRDGGVDCVAWDMRPILGGKVVIQAKRYKNTVGVSAVRDLYGTMQNERATKGILVATSGYGTASYDFAGDKPMELLDGANLLALLKEYADIDAKIEAPDDWVDPIPD